MHWKQTFGCHPPFFRRWADGIRVRHKGCTYTFLFWEDENDSLRMKAVQFIFLVLLYLRSIGSTYTYSWELGNDQKEVVAKLTQIMAIYFQKITFDVIAGLDVCISCSVHLDIIICLTPSRNPKWSAPRVSRQNGTWETKVRHMSQALSLVRSFFSFLRDQTIPKLSRVCSMLSETKVNIPTIDRTDK